MAAATKQLVLDRLKPVGGIEADGDIDAAPTPRSQSRLQTTRQIRRENQVSRKFAEEPGSVEHVLQRFHARAGIRPGDFLDRGNDCFQ